MSEDISELNMALSNVSIVYRYTLYLYFIIIPIFTASILITFISNKLSILKSQKKTQKPVYIFTELNEKSYLLAKTLKKENNIVIICSLNEKNEYTFSLKKENILLVKRQILDLNMKNYKGNIYIYAMSSDKDKNCSETLAFIEKYKNTNQKITYYFFTTDEIDRILLDSTDKGNILTIIINEIENMVFHVLDEKPLYELAFQNQINCLIIGCGQIGMEFFKAILWCGQIIGYQLQINVIDKNAQQIKSQLQHDCPEINERNYQIHFYEADIFTKESNDILKTLDHPNYIIISLKEEDFNIKGGIYLRRYFFKTNQMPMIGIHIESEEKKKKIEILEDEKKNPYMLYPFGTLKELYTDNYFLNEKIETLAEQIHLHYDPNDTELKNYNKLEYNKKSSRSTALHIKYKIYSILGENKTIKDLKKKIKDPKVLEALAENEHNRWNAYERTEGYQTASIKEVKEYFPQTKSHINHLAKLHPCITEFKNLDNLSKQIKQITGTEKDFKANDFKVIEMIADLEETKEK